MRLTLLLLLLAVPGFAQKPGVGKLLIASPRVTNAQFRHAVVLLIGYGPKGAVGVILNRPLAKTIAAAFPNVASAHDRTDAAFAGGPVQPARVFCLVSIAGKIREAREVLPNLYFSDNQNLMDLALNAREPATTFRVYLGYAGWTPGQLQRELASGAWLIQSATPAEIFDPSPATLWSRLTAPPSAASGGASSPDTGERYDSKILCFRQDHQQGPAYSSCGLAQRDRSANWRPSGL